MEEKNLVELEQQLEEKDRKIQELEERIGSIEQKQKKRMKWWKKLLIVLGVIAAIVVAVSSAVLIMRSQDKESPVMAEQVIQAIIDRDGEAAYALMYPGLVEKQEFLTAFEKLSQLWYAQGGENTFSMQQRGWQMNSRNGVTQYTVTYKVTSGTAVFNFEMSRMVRGNVSGLIRANILFVI